MLAVNIKSYGSEMIIEAKAVEARSRCQSGLGSEPCDIVDIYRLDGEIDRVESGKIFVMSDGKTVAKYDLRKDEPTGAVDSRSGS
jgi:hypothetical protein